MRAATARGRATNIAVRPAPHFKIVLSARDNDESPSDLEYDLRAVSDRVKVVNAQNLSGAHFHCVKERMAIRAYYPYDLEKISLLSKDDDDDFDGLVGFLRSFQFALVLFVLPADQPIFQQQIGDYTSHFHRAQRLVKRHSSKTLDKNLRVLLFPDTDSAVQGLMSIAKVLKPNIKEGKREFIKQLHNKYLVPDVEPGATGMPPDMTIPDDCIDSARTRVIASLSNLAATIGLPENEENVLMAFLGSLENIAYADAVTLEALPLEKRSIEKLLTFFGSSEAPANSTEDLFEHNDSTRDSNLLTTKGIGVPGEEFGCHQKSFGADFTNKVSSSSVRPRSSTEHSLVAPMNQYPYHGLHHQGDFDQGWHQEDGPAVLNPFIVQSPTFPSPQPFAPHPTSRQRPSTARTKTALPSSRYLHSQSSASNELRSNFFHERQFSSHRAPQPSSHVRRREPSATYQEPFTQAWRARFSEDQPTYQDDNVCEIIPCWESPCDSSPLPRQIPSYSHRRNGHYHNQSLGPRSQDFGYNFDAPHPVLPQYRQERQLWGPQRPHAGYSARSDEQNSYFSRATRR